jgi:ATP-dependent DNA ligase
MSLGQTEAGPAQIAFVEWTDAGHLKHCTFIGMRNERDARKAARSSESSEQDG